MKVLVKRKGWCGWRWYCFPVPPKISLSAEQILHLGERTSFTCSVNKGDPPLTVSWLKDGRPLDPKHRLAVQQVDQFNSMLIIHSLSPEHNGNYSCVARNPAAEVVYTQRLVVNGISKEQDSSFSHIFFFSFFFLSFLFLSHSLLCFNFSLSL